MTQNRGAIGGSKTEHHPCRRLDRRLHRRLWKEWEREGGARVMTTKNGNQFTILAHRRRICLHLPLPRSLIF